MSLPLKVATQELLGRDEVLRIALKHEGVVFGGYLRDLVSSLKHTKSDVDVWFLDDAHAQAFMIDLAEWREIRIKKHRNSDYYGGYGNYGKPHDGSFKHYRVCSINFETYVDVVITDNPHKVAADVDINMLMYDKGGLRVATPPGVELNLFTVLKHVRAGVFEKLPSCPDWRLKRMVEKGWKPLNSG